MKTKKQTTAGNETNPLLAPNISVKGRFLWALLRHFEQTRGQSPMISELTSIIGFREETLHAYLRELERHGCLTFKMQFSTHPIPPDAEDTVSTNVYAVLADDQERERQ